MAKPDTPYTRREMYLDSIAGGNASIPDHPHTREEMYLDAIAKNGGGGGSGDSDLSVIIDATNSSVTMSQTYATIRAALESGDKIVGGKILMDDDGNYAVQISRWSLDTDSITAYGEPSYYFGASEITMFIVEVNVPSTGAATATSKIYNWSATES